MSGVVAATPGMSIMFLAILDARRRRRRLASLHAEFAAACKNAALLDVRYASERRFRSVLKLFPWEMVGVLVVRDDGIEAHLVSTNGKKRKELVFHPDAYTIEWKTPTFFRNGVIPWLIVSGAEEKHYFTSETGATIFRAKRRTSVLIERIQSTLRLAKCRQCEYLLWGNTTGVCPECGTAYMRPAANAQ